jgi:hypothetical protein
VAEFQLGFRVDPETGIGDVRAEEPTLLWVPTA